MKNKSLNKQLTGSGAKSTEVNELTNLASNLSSIKTRGLSDDTRQKIEEITGIKKTKSNSLLWTAPSLAAGMAMLIIVFVGVTSITSKNNTDRAAPTSEQVPVSEEELEEIEMILEQSKMEIKELQQTEVPKPEELKQAEDKYEEALNRRDRWESSRNNNRNRGNKDNSPDVRGDYNDRRDNNYLDLNRWERYLDRR